jgi:hypothetical protein
VSFVNYFLKLRVLKLVNETNTRFILTIIEILNEVVHIRSGTNFKFERMKMYFIKEKRARF